jgi:hypothetical protein
MRGIGCKTRSGQEPINVRKRSFWSKEITKTGISPSHAIRKIVQHENEKIVLE